MRNLKPINVIREKLDYFVIQTPEARFMIAIVYQAINDVIAGRKEKTTKPERVNYKSAIKYLQGDIKHAEMVGAESDYVRRVMRQNGVEI